MVRRIVIKGTSGAGKTTLARAVSERLRVPCIELDAHHHGPDWRAASAEELRASVAAALDDARGWVVDGNYEAKLGDFVLDRAELVVWLDLPFGTKLWRWCAARRGVGGGPKSCGTATERPCSTPFGEGTRCFGGWYESIGPTAATSRVSSRRGATCACGALRKLRRGSRLFRAELPRTTRSCR